MIIVIKQKFGIFQDNIGLFDGFQGHAQEGRLLGEWIGDYLGGVLIAGNLGLVLPFVLAAALKTAQGSSTVNAKGTLVFHMARAKKAIKSAPFELKKGTPVKVGDIELKVQSAGKPSFGEDALEVEFQTGDKAVTMLAGVKFYDVAGNELESKGVGSSSMGFGNKYTYGRSYSLKEAVKGKVVLEFEVWTDLKEAKLPFSIAAGVGG